ncbi:hypothetical protein N431DRAFT_462129 [Stipitochalara longipes BDJ]|nr:hypothetical protein N431DRAFT_462129 [Stipitochalara longipes BDJ]
MACSVGLDILIEQTGEVAAFCNKAIQEGLQRQARSEEELSTLLSTLFMTGCSEEPSAGLDTLIEQTRKVTVFCSLLLLSEVKSERRVAWLDDRSPIRLLSRERLKEPLAEDTQFYLDLPDPLAYYPERGLLAFFGEVIVSLHCLRLVAGGALARARTILGHNHHSCQNTFHDSPSNFANPQDLWLPNDHESSLSTSIVAPFFSQTTLPNTAANFVESQQIDSQEHNLSYLDDDSPPLLSLAPGPTICANSSTSEPSSAHDSNVARSLTSPASQKTLSKAHLDNTAHHLGLANNHSQRSNLCISKNPEDLYSIASGQPPSPVSSTTSNSAQSSKSVLIQCEFAGCPRAFTYRHAYK